MVPVNYMTSSSIVALDLPTCTVPISPVLDLHLLLLAQTYCYMLLYMMAFLDLVLVLALVSLVTLEPL
jgi:hypothetical protein